MISHLNLKKGDKVEIIAGKDKKKNGKILKSYPSTKKIIVEGINKVKKHKKGNQENPKGNIIEKEMPIHISNALLFCSKCNRGVRYGYEIKNDKKIRICKKCRKILD